MNFQRALWFRVPVSKIRHKHYFLTTLSSRIFPLYNKGR